LIANWSAAKHYSESHLDQHWNYVEDVEYYYITGFFMVTSTAVIRRVAKHAARNNKVTSSISSFSSLSLH
jgi:hypothetical protein